MYNAFLSLECSHLRLVPKNGGKERVWGFKSQRVGEASHPGPVVSKGASAGAGAGAGGPVVSKVATLNVDGFDEPTWFMVRGWMVDEGVDALAVQEHKLLMHEGGPSGGDDMFMTFMGEAGVGKSGDPAGGVGWIVRREWADRVGFQLLQRGQREVVISVGGEEGRVKMASVYSQKCGDVKVRKEKGKVVMGDTNDGLRGHGENGREWASTFAKAELRVLNREGDWASMPTRFPSGVRAITTRPSHLDVWAAPEGVIAEHNIRCVGVGGLNHRLHGMTDHRPVVCTMEVESVAQKRRAQPKKFNLKRVEKDPKLKEAYRKELGRRLGGAPAKGSPVAETLAFITMAMVAAAVSTIGHVKHHKPKRWWDDKVHQASLNKKRAHSAISEEQKRGRAGGWTVSAQTHPELHGDRKRATKALKDAVKVAKARERGTVIESDPNAVHRMVAKGLGGGSSARKYMGGRATLNWRGHVGEGELVGEEAVAEGVSKFTEEVAAGNDLSGTMDDEFREEVKWANTKIFDGEQGCVGITSKQYDRVAKSLAMKLRKAKGMDGATNWMIVWGGDALKKRLLPLFEDMFEQEVVPGQLSKVRVVYIHKGKGPLQEISGYRPISLISCIGKMYTAMLLSEIAAKVGPHIGPAQGAFRKGSGAVEQAWLFEQLAAEQLEEEGEHPHVMLTDLEKCYDSIWREGLYFKLYAMGVRGRMLRNIKQWLESTEMYPVWNGVECPRVVPREGLKQGCVLSPILCAVFMSSWTAPRPSVEAPEWAEDLLQKTFSQGAQESGMGWQSGALGAVVPSLQFCDDATLLAKGKVQMVALFTRYLGWCDKFRLTVNIGKCSATKLSKPMPKRSMDAARDAIREWREPVEAERKLRVEGRKNKRKRGGKGGLAREESAKRVPYKQEPFCKVKGKEVAETFQFRVLGFRADCTMRAGPALEYAEECVTKAKWPVAWVRRQIGEVAASKFVSSRTAPKALFGCEVHGDKALGRKLETRGKVLIRIAMGIGPREGQMAPPDLCLYANKAWVPWSMECSLRKDRLHKSLKASGSTTWPGIVYAKGGKSVGKPTVVFPKRAPPGSNCAKAAKWVGKRKREEVSKIKKYIKPDSVKEWVVVAGRSKTPSGRLPCSFRRWRAGLFEIPVVKTAGVHPQYRHCTLCKQRDEKATAVHYLLKCSHYEVEKHREDMMAMFDEAMSDPELAPMHKVWEDSTEGQKIRSMVCAIPSVSPKGLWPFVETSVKAFLKEVGEVKTFWDDSFWVV